MDVDEDNGTRKEIYNQYMVLTGCVVYRALRAFQNDWTKLVGTAMYRTGLDILGALLNTPGIVMADFKVPLHEVVDTRTYNLAQLVQSDLEVCSDFHAVDLSTRLVVPMDSSTFCALSFQNDPSRVRDANHWITALDIPASESGMGKVVLKAPPGSTDFITMGGSCLQHEWTCGTAMVPPGAITHAHCDYNGATTVCVHVSGRKLWCFWDATPENLDFVVRNGYPGNENGLDCIKHLTGLRVKFFDDTQEAFALPPFTIHMVLTLTASIHFGGPIYEWKNAGTSLDHIEHVLQMAENNLQPSYRDILHGTLDNDLANWMECASALKRKLSSQERTEFHERCRELKRKAGVCLIYSPRQA